LWGNVPLPHSRHSLRQALTAIRRTLGPYASTVLESNRDIIRIRPGAITVDIELIRKLSERGSIRGLGVACALACGELLVGIEIGEVEFDRWLVAQRARARQIAVVAHERYINALLKAGKREKAIDAAFRLVALDPLHERGYALLMNLHAAQGQFGAALRLYDTCARMLLREVGIEPCAETKQLRRDLIALSRRITPVRREAS
jgi:DNA-binding SARP family transcriptional activator